MRPQLFGRYVYRIKYHLPRLITHPPAAFGYFGLQFAGIPSAVAQQASEMAWQYLSGMQVAHCLLHAATIVQAGHYHATPADVLRTSVQQVQHISLYGPALVQGQCWCMPELLQMIKWPVMQFIDHVAKGASTWIVLANEHDRLFEIIVVQ